MVALEAGRPVPPEVADWLLDGLCRFQGGEVDTLCRALALRRPGRTGSPAYRAALEARNAALNEAAMALEAKGRWQTAVLLAEAVHAFETRTWPRLRHQPAAALPPLQAALHRAFRAHGRVPSTPEGLYPILK